MMILPAYLMTENNPVVAHKPCPVCRANGKDKSGDNLVIFKEGPGHCFSCAKNIRPIKFTEGQIIELTSRNIKEETARKYNYQIGRFNGYFTLKKGLKIGQVKGVNKVVNHKVKIMNYYDEKGFHYAQLLKDYNKNIKIIGHSKDLGLYGKWLWEPNEKLFVVITEGQEDAMAVCEAQGLLYPVVSVPNGAESAYKAILKDLKWLMGFKHVVLWFDDDEAGQKAIDKVSDLFEVGKVKVVHCKEYKDANDILKDNSLAHEDRYAKIKACVWNAKPVGTDAIVTMSDLMDELLVQPTRGIDYAWEPMTDITYGYQPGEAHIIVGPTGVGKTEFVLKMLLPFLEQFPIGIFSFEQVAANTARRIIGNALNLKLHIPGTEWNIDLIRQKALEYDGKIYLYNHQGQCDLENLFKSIRYMAKALGVKAFVIDNLKALRLGELERATHFMNVIAALKLELQISIYILSHVAKDKYQLQTYVSTSPKKHEEYMAMRSEDVEKMIRKPGLDWESGRMPTIENIDGHNVISALVDYVWGLGRHTTSQDHEEKSILKIKALKTRLDSSKTGKVFKLRYNSNGNYEVVGGSYGDQTNDAY